MGDSKELNKKDKKKEAKKKPSGLGRGLDSLLSDIKREEPVVEAGTSESDVVVLDGGGQQAAVDARGISSLAVSAIRPNPDQPRRHFEEAALAELADSIKERGLIQPIVVRPAGKNYQIVAGERRWRAAQRAQLHKIPAIIRDFDDSETLEIAIVENVQREDLNVIEEAEAYARLSNDYGYNQARLAELVGKSRSHVANLMRLLDLPQKVRDQVAQGDLQMGHARALIGQDDAIKMAAEIIRNGLSVRETEKLVKQWDAGGKSGKPAKKRPSVGEYDADIRAIERQLGELLGLKVTIQTRGKDGAGAGSLTVDYSNLDQLDMICQRLTGEQI